MTRVQVIDEDAIQAQIVHQHITIVRGYGGAMGVGSSLALRVGAMAAVLKAGNSFAECSVRKTRNDAALPPP